MTFDPDLTCETETDNYAAVAEVCNGQPTCVINPNGGLFGDPCEGTVKQMEASYVCQGMYPILYKYTYLKSFTHCDIIMTSHWSHMGKY